MCHPLLTDTYTNGQSDTDRVRGAHTHPHTHTHTRCKRGGGIACSGIRPHDGHCSNIDHKNHGGPHSRMQKPTLCMSLSHMQTLCVRVCVCVCVCVRAHPRSGAG